jgi:hypothetical protein
LILPRRFHRTLQTSNVAVYLANAAAGSVVVRNRAEVLAALRRPRAGKRDR